MPYFQLRLTPGEIPRADESLDCFIDLFNNIIQKWKPNVYALCKEYKNKFGESTRPHYHFNFEAEAELDAMRKSIIRYLGKQNINIKGNKMYALQRITEPKDFNRWIRYILKEKGAQKMYEKYWNVPNFDKNLEGKLAEDERKRAIEANLKYRAKSIEKLSFFDKMSKTLKEKTHRGLFKEICRYYQDHSKSINAMTIEGYAITHAMNEGLLDVDDFYEASAKLKNLF